MAARLTLAGLEWLAVAAATVLAAGAFANASAPTLAACVAALIGSGTARSLALRAAAGAQLDGLLDLMRKIAAERPADEGDAA